MGSGLVNGQAHLLKTGNLQNVFAQVVVQVVEREVGHHLFEDDDVFVRDIAPGEVVPVNSYFLVGTALATLDVYSGSIHVVGEQVVVDVALEGGGRTTRIRPD